MVADVIIVGGGPAGMSAALVLGRCRRRVLLFDHRRYRNARARGVHGYLTRDGVHPAELRRIARAELAQYPNVSIRETEVTRVKRTETGFDVQVASGDCTSARKLLLATGLIDKLPSLAGIEELVGACAFHCPYCDGWELRDLPLVAYGGGDQGAALALELTLWSKDVTLCTNGCEPPTARMLAKLMRFGVKLDERAIARVEGDDHEIRITFADSSRLARRALFYSEGSEQASPLAAQLGAEFTEKGGVEAGRLETTSVPGLFVAGDASREALQAIVAAGEGSKAAIAINQALMKEDMEE